MDWRRLRTEVLRLTGEQLEYPDVFDPGQLSGDPDLLVQKAGGGYLVGPRCTEAIEEVHVFLHGSVRVPASIRWAVGPCDPMAAASTLVDNCDLGTSALAMELALWIARAHTPNRSLAYFDVTRVLLDANRYRIEEQVQERPYRGLPILQSHLNTAQKDTLVKQLLLPWVDLVSAAITGGGVRRVFHHHTYDPVGQPSGYSSGRPRPAGMFFLRSPLEPIDSPTAQPGTLLDPNLLTRLLVLLENCLRQIRPDAEICVDSPYLCPLMPLLPGIMTGKHTLGPASKMATIIYEIRKDLLRRKKDLQTTVDAIKIMSEEAAAFQAA